jgi:hypothetical protein
MRRNRERASTFSADIERMYRSLFSSRAPSAYRLNRWRWLRSAKPNPRCAEGSLQTVNELSCTMPRKQPPLEKGPMFLCRRLKLGPTTMGAAVRCFDRGREFRGA